jgi:hypothetical protein
MENVPIWNEPMKKVISASRRTDLVAFFPEWLSSAIKKGEADVHGPSGHAYTVDLDPNVVHTVVLWSKNFQNLIENFAGLRESLLNYDQIYCHFTITGLGGSFIERGVPSYRKALGQLGDLNDITGTPDRVTVRFDPVVYWQEEGGVRTNLRIFEKMAPVLQKKGIKNIRISFAQWYRKAIRRAAIHGFSYVDPPEAQKLADARFLVEVAREWGLHLFSCSQDFLTEIPEIHPSSCIDGPFLQKIHPYGEAVSHTKDKTQRAECRCTQSVDIGSYTQFCPHSCLYCYANPKT